MSTKTKVLLQTIIFEATVHPPYSTYIDRIDMYIISATRDDLKMLEEVNGKTADDDQVAVRKLLHLLGKTPFYRNQAEFEEFKLSEYVLEGEIEAVENVKLGAWRKYRIEENDIEEAKKVFSFIFD